MGQKVLIQNQTGKSKLRWDKSGTVGQVFPYDQYVVKIDGSNRLTRRNRRFLRAYKPAVSYDPVPHVAIGEDIGEAPGSDWGARGVVTRSQASGPLSSAPGESVVPPMIVDDDSALLEDSNSGSRDVVDEAEPSVDVPVVSPRRTVPVSETIVRKSGRANKGKTLRYEDYVVGQELDGVGD